MSKENWPAAFGRSRYLSGMTNIFIGTAGWSYADWERLVYPPGKAGDRLRTVAGFLDCVEVDSTFYRPPTPRAAAGWVAATPPRFRFLAKAWQRFTHQRDSKWSREDFDLFVEGLLPLRDRLDALLFQFPWSFRNNPGNRDWLAGISDAFAGWPIAVEVRHDSWTEDFFRERRIIFCNIDQPQLNHCLAPTAIVTGDIGYYRLHGRNTKNWFREEQDAHGGRYDYLYSEAELDELLPKIRETAAKAKRTFVIFNNHRDAKAFSNALQLKARLAPDARLRAPAALIERYRALRACVTASDDEQLSLV
jgi:uncharacterized protein YecE (DUF72 family)